MSCAHRRKRVRSITVTYKRHPAGSYDPYTYIRDCSTQNAHSELVIFLSRALPHQSIAIAHQTNIMHLFVILGAGCLTSSSSSSSSSFFSSSLAASAAPPPPAPPPPAQTPQQQCQTLVSHSYYIALRGYGSARNTITQGTAQSDLIYTFRMQPLARRVHKESCNCKNGRIITG
jgi:hypothetical protein